MNRFTVAVLGLLALVIPALTTAVILADLSPEARSEVTSALSSQVAVLAVGLAALVAAIVGVAYGSYRTAKRRDQAIATEVDMMVRANPGHRLVEDSDTARSVNRLADEHHRAEDRLEELLAAAHEELQAERDDLVDVLAGLDVPVGVIDIQGRILLVNPAARARLGGEVPVAAGRSIYSIFSARDLAPLVERAAAGEQPTATVGDTVLRLVRISGDIADEFPDGESTPDRLARVLIIGDIAPGSAIPEAASEGGVASAVTSDGGAGAVTGDGGTSAETDSAVANSVTGSGGASVATGNGGAGAVTGDGGTSAVAAVAANLPHLRISSDLGRTARLRIDEENWPNTPLSDLVFTVVDCETTGLHVVNGDRLVAVAAVRVDGARVRSEDTFDRLANPGIPIPEVSRDIHGISDEMVADASSPGEVVAAFSRYAADSILVGHHLGFDRGFLDPVAQRASVALPQLGVDTMLLSAVLFTTPDIHHGLDALCERLGVPIIGRHTALGDALATAEVLVRMMPMLRERGIVTLADARKAAAATELASRINNESTRPQRRA
jgi:DNA polymerase III epsilon subunit-like protein/PAS domain-containing protein